MAVGVPGRVAALAVMVYLTSLESNRAVADQYTLSGLNDKTSGEITPQHSKPLDLSLYQQTAEADDHYPTTNVPLESIHVYLSRGWPSNQLVDEDEKSRGDAEDVVNGVYHGGESLLVDEDEMSRGDAEDVVNGVYHGGESLLNEAAGMTKMHLDYDEVYDVAAEESSVVRDDAINGTFDGLVLTGLSGTPFIVPTTVASDRIKNRTRRSTKRCPVKTPSTGSAGHTNTVGNTRPTDTNTNNGEAGTDSNTKPLTNGNAGPATSNNVRPATSNNARPATSNNAGPATSNNARPATSNNARPATSNTGSTTRLSNRFRSSNGNRGSIISSGRPSSRNIFGNSAGRPSSSINSVRRTSGIISSTALTSGSGGSLGRTGMFSVRKPSVRHTSDSNIFSLGRTTSNGGSQRNSILGSSGGSTSGRIGGTSGHLGGTSGHLGGTSGRFGGTSGRIGSTSGRFGGTSGRIGGTSGRIGGTSGRFGGTSGRIRSTSGRIGSPSGRTGSRIGSTSGRIGSTSGRIGSTSGRLGTTSGRIGSRIGGTVGRGARGASRRGGGSAVSKVGSVLRLVRRRG